MSAWERHLRDLRYGPDSWESQPRDEHGRWDGPPDDSGDSSDTVAGAAVAAAKEGGGTLDPTTGEPVTSGIAVAVDGHSGIYPAEQFFSNDANAASTVRGWMDANAEVLSQPNMNVGVWHDVANGEVVLDPSEVVQDRATGIALGIARDQQAVYDIGAGEEIPTGGTGGRAAQAPYSPEAQQAVQRDDGGGEGRAGPGDRRPGEGQDAPAPHQIVRRPLPAHRYLERQQKQDDPPTWVFDFDETITGAPEQLARIATALHGLGDKIVVVTGNTSPRNQLVERLTNDYHFPFDQLIQYDDTSSNGIRRAEILKRLDAFCGFDNRVDRAYTYAKVCPHLYVIAKPTKEAKGDAPHAKKDAKQAIKASGA